MYYYLLKYNDFFIKIKDFNPGAIVNRELTNRIRPVMAAVSHHKSVVKNDIKLAMRIIQNMDRRWGLWREAGEEDVEMEREEDEVEMKEVVKTGDEKTDSENTEIANLERAAFSAIKSTEPKFLSHKVSSMGRNPNWESVNYTKIHGLAKIRKNKKRQNYLK